MNLLRYVEPRIGIQEIRRIIQHLGSGGEFHLFLTSTLSMVHNAVTILDIDVLSENLVRSSSLALEKHE